MCQKNMADVEEKIEYLFYKGYTYEEIVGLLSVEYGTQISLSTLKRKLKDMNLSRKNVTFDINFVRQVIEELLDGPNCCVGYRSVWHCLKLRGIIVPRLVIQQLMQEIDPEGVQARKAHRLQRRQYHSPGPNSVWHADGYDKLKPYGFPIHGCIDGFSRKVIWLYVTRSNNYPDNIAAYYLDSVKELGGCPRKLNTDLGTENGTMAGIHCFFMNNEDSHQYVASPKNQRIEAWWSFLRKNWSNWWINFFKDLIEREILNTSDPIQRECIWFCFSNLIQASLNEVKESWNTHYIRKSRHDTICGRPNAIYSLPEAHGGVGGLIVDVPDNELEYAIEHLVEKEDENEYHDYFKYVADTLNLNVPSHWREALQLYQNLISVAVNGL